MRSFNIIVACSENRVIGIAGKLPWSIPEDSEFFRNKTAGHSVIMGRVCFDEWKDACSLGRSVFVLTTSPLPKDSTAVAVSSLNEGLQKASLQSGEIFICGGEAVYQEAIAHPLATRLYLTLVHRQFTGDRLFPDWKLLFAREIDQRSAEHQGLKFTYLTLEKAI